jgi:ATP-binding protein involved in chromosome partitioning
LMDCDLYGPSVPLLIGASGRPELVGDNILAPVESYGVKSISMGLLIDEESPVVWRGPMIMKTIQQFAHNVLWGDLDYLLIDLPPGTGDAQLSLAQILPLDGAILITTPQKAAVDVARRGATTAQVLKCPFLGEIPLHEEVRLGGDHGTPVVVANEENPSSKEICLITEKITEIVP